MFTRANQLRVRMVIEYNGEPHRIMSMNHVTPGKGNAIVQTKLRNLVTGVQTENRFRATEDVPRVTLEQKTMQYLYKEGDALVFMDMESFEQMNIHEDDIGDDALFLMEGQEIEVQTWNGRLVGVELPKVVELEVTECPPYLKGATATNKPKPATLETGIVITVPNFINPGDRIKVDTEERKYLERASKE